MKIFLIVSKRINKLLINGANISYQHKLKHCQNLTKLLRQFPFDLGIPLFRTGITIVLTKIKSNNHPHTETCYRQTGYIAVAKKWKSSVVAHLSPQQSGGSGKGTEQYTEIISQKKENGNNPNTDK